MIESIGFENSSSIIYYDEDLPVIDAGRSIWEISILYNECVMSS